ncbi:GNAT family N-acetyltransferase [Roseobacter ponti]|uniref:GNAT family N-acetyltransferase n=1 Tax=Roseobacter ponti TaxID=1891787 RepID=A0A858SY44_9RHOB|nr:GNAT family N-acetyltransferase [Roseobacter ponti]QJF52573.1 GNAT family N-acetyltransferase [Roseobacter ponti]
MAPDVRPLTGGDLRAALPQLADLRIAVFRDWPYLYDGDAEYEQAYLAPYADNPAACVIGAFDGSRLVGAATALPLADHADDFSAAFAGSGTDPAGLWYCAESVLQPDYRGQGIGHRFFDLREAQGRALGFNVACFCAVTRPRDHPARPRHARSLHPFWRARGYAPVAGAVAQFSWRDIGDTEETTKPLQFWMRDL